nr:MAG TPA: hypothetical protein [Bacteriophage sp.]
MDSGSVFQNYELFIFRRFFGKWTQSLKFGLLKTLKFKTKLQALYSQTMVGIAIE